MPLTKTALTAQLSDQLREKLSTCEEALTSTRAAFASDTKSSAGDKHEVGRAMVQQELDKLERRDPMKKFCEKVSVQKTLVGNEVRENSPIRSPIRGKASSPKKKRI